MTDCDFNYSGSPDANDPISVVRFNLPDVDENNPLLTDTEISFLISSTATLRLAAAAGADVIAGKMGNFVDTSIGRTSISLSQKADKWAARARMLRSGEAGIFPGEDGSDSMYAIMIVGGISKSKKEDIHSDEDFDPESFSVGMDDMGGRRDLTDD